MSLLPNEEQQNGGSGGGDAEGLEAYAPVAPKRAARKPRESSAEESPGPERQAGGLRVSLMPTELEGRAPADPRKRVLVLLIVLVVETFLIGAAHLFISQRIASRSDRRVELEQKLAQLTATIAEKESKAKEVVTFAAQVRAAEEALDEHVYWSKFYGYLESRTRQGVRYLNFSGDAETRVVTVDAVGGTYRDVAEQIVALRADEHIEDVRTSSAAARIDALGQIQGIAFTLILRFAPEVFKGKAPFTPAEGSAASEAGVSAAGGGDCGTVRAPQVSTCFAQKFSACETATLVRTFTETLEYRYEILGQRSGGCGVRVAFTKNADADLVGPEMICALDEEKTFETAWTEAADADYAPCAGQLRTLLLGVGR